jgi:drug/metabolite transporter (DMT)-like permease
MRSIAGAIVLLAAAVLFAGGTIAEALIASQRADGSIPGRFSMIGGVILVLVGLGMLTATSKPNPPHGGG